MGSQRKPSKYLGPSAVGYQPGGAGDVAAAAMTRWRGPKSQISAPIQPVSPTTSPQVTLSVAAARKAWSGSWTTSTSVTIHRTNPPMHHHHDDPQQEKRAEEHAVQC